MSTAVPGFAFLWDEATDLASVILKRLLEQGATLTCAESCTGGLIAAALTEVPGSSGAFKGSVVSYWADVKEGVLGVDAQTIEGEGVVSCACAEEMAFGAAKLMGCDYALSTTGLAGPGGAEPGKPVGTVCIALKTPDALRSGTIHAQGDRQQVRGQAVVAALTMLAQHLGVESS